MATRGSNNNNNNSATAATAVAAALLHPSPPSAPAPSTKVAGGEIFRPGDPRLLDPIVQRRAVEVSQRTIFLDGNEEREGDNVMHNVALLCWEKLNAPIPSPETAALTMTTTPHAAPIVMLAKEADQQLVRVLSEQEPDMVQHAQEETATLQTLVKLMKTKDEEIAQAEEEARMKKAATTMTTMIGSSSPSSMGLWHSPRRPTAAPNDPTGVPLTLHAAVGGVPGGGAGMRHKSIYHEARSGMRRKGAKVPIRCTHCGVMSNAPAVNAVRPIHFGAVTPAATASFVPGDEATVAALASATLEPVSPLSAFLSPLGSPMPSSSGGGGGSHQGGFNHNTSAPDGNMLAALASMKKAETRYLSPLFDVPNEEVMDQKMWDLIASAYFVDKAYLSGNSSSVGERAAAMAQHFRVRVGPPPWEVFFRRQNQHDEATLLRAQNSLAADTAKMQRIRQKIAAVRIESKALQKCLGCRCVATETAQVSVSLTSETDRLESLERELQFINDSTNASLREELRLVERISVELESTRRCSALVTDLVLAASKEPSLSAILPAEKVCQLMAAVLDAMPTAAITERSAQHGDGSTKARPSVSQRDDEDGDEEDPAAALQCRECLLLRAFSKFCPMTGRPHTEAYATPEVPVEAPPPPPPPAPAPTFMDLEEAAEEVDMEDETKSAASNSTDTKPKVLPLVLGRKLRDIVANRVVPTATAAGTAEDDEEAEETTGAGGDSDAGSDADSRDGGAGGGGGTRAKKHRKSKNKKKHVANVFARMMNSMMPSTGGRGRQASSTEGGEEKEPMSVEELEAAVGTTPEEEHCIAFFKTAKERNVTRLRQLCRGVTEAVQATFAMKKETIAAGGAGGGGGGDVASGGIPVDLQTGARVLEDIESQFCEWFALTAGGIELPLVAPLTNKVDAVGAFKKLLTATSVAQTEARVRTLRKELRELHYSFTKRPKGRSAGATLDDEPFKALIIRIIDLERRNAALRGRMKHLAVDRRALGKQAQAALLGGGGGGGGGLVGGFDQM